MSQTHELLRGVDRLTKRYRSWDRGEHVREWAVLQRVHERHPDLAPEPLFADLDACPPTITMTVLPGETVAGVVDAASQAALAEALERLWSVPCGGLPLRRHHPVEIHTLMSERMRGVGLAGRPGEAADAARSFLAAHRPVPAEAVVLGHADPNGANYLWDGDRVRIVDFEDAGVSDREYELADHVEHLANRTTDWTPLLSAFDLDAERLLAARRLYATFWLHMLRPGGPSAARNPPGTLEQQAERLLALLG